MVRKRIVPHSAIDVRVYNHPMATLSTALMHLEPTVMPL